MYTKAVLREQPEAGSLVEWSREWFSQRVAERGEPSRESTPFSPERGSHLSLASLPRSSLSPCPRHSPTPRAETSELCRDVHSCSCGGAGAAPSRRVNARQSTVSSAHCVCRRLRLR